MDIFLGIQDLKVPIWELNTPIMINQLSWHQIPWENKTWVDSGGYQIMKKNIKINLEDVERKYKILKADSYMNLDIPSFPCQNIDERNFKNFEYFYTRDINVIPVIHAYNADDIDKALDFYKQYTNIIAFGGIVPPSLKGGRKLVIHAYHYIRKNINRIHVLGAGSPFMRKIFFNTDSVDTSTYRIKGAMGLVIIPGKGERYVGKREISWHTKKAIKEELNHLLMFLEKTKYPYIININDWVNRSLINAWVIMKSEYEGESWETLLSRKVDKMNRTDIRNELVSICSHTAKFS